MNNTHSIIVYRNPLEAAFWESGMAFNLIVLCAISFILLYASLGLIERFTKCHSKTRHALQLLAFIGSVAIAFYVAFFMMVT